MVKNLFMSLYDKIVAAQEAADKVKKSAKKIKSKTIRDMERLNIFLSSSMERVKNDNSN